MSPKSESIAIPSLFRHYKGGKYRILFMAVDTGVRMQSNDAALLDGYHADHTDERPMKMNVFTRGGVHMVYVDRYERRIRSSQLVVIYVSVGRVVDGVELPGYGSIWARDSEEFFGDVDIEKDGKIITVRRFEPITSTIEPS